MAVTKQNLSGIIVANTKANATGAGLTDKKNSPVFITSGTAVTSIGIVNQAGNSILWQSDVAPASAATATADGATAGIVTLAASNDKTSLNKAATPAGVAAQVAAGSSAGASKLTPGNTIQTDLASTTAVNFDGTAAVKPGVTGILPIANGGTGNNAGLAASATKLATARTIRTNLAATTAASFDGTANITPGVSGTLPIANGGTGNTTGKAVTADALTSGLTGIDGVTLELVSGKARVAAMHDYALFDIKPNIKGTGVDVGFLSVCVNNGELTGAAYPTALSLVKTMKAAGGNVVTFTQWLNEYNSTGICTKFALSDDQTKFRIPCAPGIHWEGVSSGLGTLVGDYKIDTMRPITGEAGYGTAGLTVTASVVSGALKVGSYVFANAPITQANPNARTLGLNSALNGPNYDGPVTRPQSGIVDWQMKMYGTISDAGAVSLAQCIAAMAGKLDESVYAGDAPRRLVLDARILSTGVIDAVYGDSGLTCTRTAVGIYTIRSSLISSNSLVVGSINAASSSQLGAVARFEAITSGSFTVRTYIISSTATLADVNFSFLLFKI